MQDPEKLREIEALGEDEELFQKNEAWEDDREGRDGWGGVPLLQAVICVLAVLALLFFRITDETKYQEITDWYQHEMTQELELPMLSRATPEPSLSPAPTATPTPPVSASASLQML